MIKGEKSLDIVNKINNSTLLSITLSLLPKIYPDAELYSEIVACAISIIAAAGRKYIWIMNQDIEKKISSEMEKEFDLCLQDTMKLLKQRAKRNNTTILNKENELTLRNVFSDLKSLKPDGIEDYLAEVNRALEKIDAGTLGTLNEDFHSAFCSCLFSYPSLNTFLLRSETDSHIQKMNMFLGNEFVYKLSLLSYREGIMNCYYKIFSSYIIHISMNHDFAKYLSKVQEEYNTLFNMDELQIRTGKIYIKSLTDLLVGKEGADIRGSCDSLVSFYLHFIHAEKSYYEGDYTIAINQYTYLLDKSREEEIRKLNIPRTDDFIKEVRIYLTNSLAWSYQLDRQNKQAIEIYNNFFEKTKQFPSLQFKSRCLRNYGVCLEQEQQYEKAVEKYQESINNLPEGAKEYKVYITYCSSLMKQWDIETGKLTLQWMNNANRLFQAERTLLSNESFDKMQIYLHIAEMKKCMFSDTYIQEIKLFTYLMLLSSEVEIKSYIKKIKDLLFFVETIAPGQRGILYVKRDFYYALFLKEKRNDQRQKWKNLSIQINNELKGEGDSILFSKIFV